MPFAATWMDLDIIILSQISQRKTYHDTTDMWNKKKKVQKILNGINELISKQK